MPKISLSNDASISLDVSLQQYNTLAVPARAAYLSRCTTQEQIIQCVEFAEQKNLHIIVLGEGSNTVFANDVDGLVILNRLSGIELVNDTESQVTVKVAAGENWHDFVKYALGQGWYGLENLALIPGLVGAAPIQNIGAYGVEVKDLIDSVSLIDIESLELNHLSNEDCKFGYRDSVFKTDLRDRCIITDVTFTLAKVPQPVLKYPALANKFKSPPSAEQVFDLVCQIRSSKLPMPDDLPNAGSFFKNPVVTTQKYQELKQAFDDIVSFPQNNGDVKLAAGWLIDQRGWKSKSVDAVYMHREQALVLVNPNQKSGSAVLNLVRQVQADIKQCYGVNLEIEPRVY